MAYDWHKIKEGIIRETRRVFGQTPDFDMEAVSDLFVNVLQFPLDNPDLELDGLERKVPKALQKMLDETIAREQKDSHFSDATKIEPYIRKVLYLIDRKKYMNDYHDKGLYRLIEGLQLNPNGITLSKGKSEDHIGKPHFAEHLHRAYNLRNRQSHFCETLDEQRFHQNIQSVLVIYLYATKQHFDDLKRKTKLAKKASSQSSEPESLAKRYEKFQPAFEEHKKKTRELYPSSMLSPQQRRDLSVLKERIDTLCDHADMQVFKKGLQSAMGCLLGEDIRSALSVCRTVVEGIVKQVVERCGKNIKATGLFDRIEELRAKNILLPSVHSALHQDRIYGNEATHWLEQMELSVEEAENRIRDILAPTLRWFGRTYLGLENIYDIERKPRPPEERAEIEKPPPKPDADLVNPSAPISELAFSLDEDADDEDAEFTSIPFDIGTIWGLPRNRFVGILAGWENDGVYEALVRVERALYDAMMEFSAPFPRRWWIKIDPNYYPNGPQNKEEVWESAVDPDSSLVKHLKEKGLPGSDIIGVFFEIHSELDLATIQDWCVALNSKFPLPQVATVIHIVGNSIHKSRKSALNLRKELIDRKLNVPEKYIEVMTLTVQLQQEYSPEDDVAGPFEGLFGDDSGLEASGFYLYTWAKQAGIDTNKEFLAEKKKYRDLLEVLKPYYVKYHSNNSSRTTDLEAQMSASKVLSDLDSILASKEPAVRKRVYQQFFQLVEKYLPERIYALLKAGAGSEKKEVRHESLFFAAHSDMLMDAWVDGNTRDQKFFPQITELCPPPQIHRREPLTNTLVLALLRRYRLEEGSEVIKTRIEELMCYLKGNLKEACNFCLGRMTEEKFLRNYGIQGFHPIVR